MKLSKEEKELNRQAFRKMNFPEKLDYIFTYYKVELAVIAFAVIFVGSLINIRMHNKEKVVYTALVNVEVGSELFEKLNDGFIVEEGYSTKKEMVGFYQGLYLTADPSSEVFQYVYASRLKVLAAIENKQMDVVIMNQEAYDTFSQCGYLVDLEQAGLTDRFPAEAVMKNLVIYEDNAEEHYMDESIPYEAVTGEELNGLSAAYFHILNDAGLGDGVYLGIVANSPRMEAAVQYLEYLK